MPARRRKDCARSIPVESAESFDLNVISAKARSQLE